MSAPHAWLNRVTQEEEERKRRGMEEEEEVRKGAGSVEEKEDESRGKKDMQEKLNKLFSQPADPWGSTGEKSLNWSWGLLCYIQASRREWVYKSKACRGRSCPFHSQLWRLKRTQVQRLLHQKSTFCLWVWCDSVDEFLCFITLLSLCLSAGEKGPVPSLFDQKTSSVSGFDQQQPPVKVVYYRAVYPFDARSHDEISIAPGDVIMVCYIHKRSTCTLVFLRRPSCYKYTGWWRTEDTRTMSSPQVHMSSQALQYKQQYVCLDVEQIFYCPFVFCVCVFVYIRSSCV